MESGSGRRTRPFFRRGPFPFPGLPRTASPGGGAAPLKYSPPPSPPPLSPQEEMRAKKRGGGGKGGGGGSYVLGGGGGRGGGGDTPLEAAVECEGDTVSLPPLPSLLHT